MASFDDPVAAAQQRTKGYLPRIQAALDKQKAATGGASNKAEGWLAVAAGGVENRAGTRAMRADGATEFLTRV